MLQRPYLRARRGVLLRAKVALLSGPAVQTGIPCVVPGAAGPADTTWLHAPPNLAVTPGPGMAAEPCGSGGLWQVRLTGVVATPTVRVGSRVVAFRYARLVGTVRMGPPDQRVLAVDWKPSRRLPGRKGRLTSCCGNPPFPPGTIVSCGYCQWLWDYSALWVWHTDVRRLRLHRGTDGALLLQWWFPDWHDFNDCGVVCQDLVVYASPAAIIHIRRVSEKGGGV